MSAFLRKKIALVAGFLIIGFLKLLILLWVRRSTYIIIGSGALFLSKLIFLPTANTLSSSFVPASESKVYP